MTVINELLRPDISSVLNERHRVFIGGAFLRLYRVQQCQHFFLRIKLRLEQERIGYVLGFCRFWLCVNQGGHFTRQGEYILFV